MIEFNFFETLGLVLFFGAGIILLKLYVIDSLFVKTTLDNLIIFEKFKDISTKDIPEYIYPFKIKRTDDTKETIKRALLKIDNDIEIYVFDVEKKIFLPKGGYFLEYYTLVTTISKTVVDRKIIIRPKINNFIEKLIDQKESKIKHLDDDFNYIFAVSSEKRGHIHLPKLLQSDLLHFQTEFPLSERKGSITTMIKIDENSFSIICNRVSTKKDLDNLILLRDLLEVNLVKFR